MNYSEVFEQYGSADWTEHFKLTVLLIFLDKYADTIITPEMLADYLQAITKPATSSDVPGVTETSETDKDGDDIDKAIHFFQDSITVDATMLRPGEAAELQRYCLQHLTDTDAHGLLTEQGIKQHMRKFRQEREAAGVAVSGGPGLSSITVKTPKLSDVFPGAYDCTQ